MAVKAGTAYVEVKYDPDSIRSLRRDAEVEGKRISKSWEDADNGLIDFDKAAQKVNKTMSGGPFNLFDSVGNVGYALLKFGGFAQDAEQGLADLANGGEDAEKGMTGLSSVLSGLAPLVGVAATGLAGLAAALLVLPALAAAATFAFVALLDTVSILAAVVVPFLGPLAILGVLLGGLGAAFVLSGQRALKGGGIFKDFAKQVEQLTGKFHDLIYTLAGRFLPLFSELAGAASQALTYLGKIAKLPLKQAFESLGTTGVAMLNKFVYAVANALKRPFKLAIQVAFGTGGTNANTAIANWWDSLTRYLFGYQRSHPIHIGSAIVTDTKNVRGALDPIIKWFNSQHFVATGIRWAHEIINGLVRLWNNDKGFRDAVKTVAADAGHQAGKAFKAAFWAEVHSFSWKGIGIYILHQLDFSRALEDLASKAFSYIRAHASSVISGISGWISSKLSDAWGAVKHAASDAWNYIRGLFSHVLTVAVHFSVPGGSTASHLFKEATGISLPHTGGLVMPGGALALAGGGLATGGIAGRDSVPAMLTPGELVLNKQQQLALLHGGAGGPITVNVEISQDAIAGIARVEVLEGGRRTARTVKAGRKW